jgi:hypothetical protein
VKFLQFNDGEIRHVVAARESLWFLLICGDARAAHDDGGFTPFRSLRFFPPHLLAAWFWKD